MLSRLSRSEEKNQSGYGNWTRLTANSESELLFQSNVTFRRCLIQSLGEPGSEYQVQASAGDHDEIRVQRSVLRKQENDELASWTRSSWVLRYHEGLSIALFGGTKHRFIIFLWYWWVNQTEMWCETSVAVIFGFLWAERSTGAWFNHLSPAPFSISDPGRFTRSGWLRFPLSANKDSVSFHQRLIYGSGLQLENYVHKWDHPKMLRRISRRQQLHVPATKKYNAML